ncbi:hypothetical protein [Novosphingobium sp. Leaf2]|uniref:hypothetical protein n=1 Tax=Novosphingobium sp. Leaf2 TaxID=1735670 RepID=UPI0006F1F6C7|nr:hypothetical protein [Novosphingobium sp. Leaf2]KQM19645.1 hypothetical protein ASE49_05400 [Novosphingobium sp. Leaf2]
MRKFTKIVAPALIAALGLSAAAPAMAQPMRHQQQTMRHADIRADISGLRAQIDRAAQRRTISPREAAGLRNQAAQVQRLYAQYARDGLSARETRMLETRVNQVRVALHMERRDYDGRRG